MSEPKHVQDSVKVGVLVKVTEGPHVGKQGKVTEIYLDWFTKEQYRAMIELPDKKGFFQTRIEWLVRLP